MNQLPLISLERPTGPHLRAWILERQHLYSLAATAAALVVGLVVAYGHVRLFSIELNPTVITEPYLIRRGFVLYQEIGGQKSPLLPLFVAWLLPIFRGDATLTVRVAHAVFTTGIIASFLVWAYRRAGAWALLASAAFFLAWSNLYGYWALLYYDFFLTPLYLASLIFLTLPTRRQSTLLFAAFGLANGIGLLAKQHTITLALAVAACLAWGLYRKEVSPRTALRNGLVYLSGLALPGLIFLAAYFLRTGSINDVLYWLVWINLKGQYASLASKLPSIQDLRLFLPTLVLVLPYLYSLLSPAKEQQPSRATRFWLLALAVLALIYIYPRWSNRHLSIIFPFLAAISGIGFADLMRGQWGRAPARVVFRALGVLVVGWWLFHAAGLYYRSSQQSPVVFPGYTDVAELANMLQGRIPAQGTLVLLPGDEANLNLYYLMQREPPRYLFASYPWYMEDRTVQSWLDVIQREPPAAVIYFPGRWNIEQYAPQVLAYLRGHYKMTSQLTWQGNPVEVFEPVR